MTKRVAVVTDALSPDFCFPHWHRYYGALFGASNLFIVTYAGRAASFAEFIVGGLIELPVGFEEQIKADAIGRFVTFLLACYDVVIRVDADEFLVVDPAVASTLAEYVATMSEPYLTARGFDVIQLPGEAPVSGRAGVPLLRDRAYAYPNTALSKTCIVTTPMRWSVGFHWASVFPKFGPVFLLHMKRLDIGWQVELLRQITAEIGTNALIDASVREYYSPDEVKIMAYHAGVIGRPRLSGISTWYRSRLTTAFLAAMSLDPGTALYHGQYGHEEVLCEIVLDWKRML